MAAILSRGIMIIPWFMAKAIGFDKSRTWIEWASINHLYRLFVNNKHAYFVIYLDVKKWYLKQNKYNETSN